jgi:hypothetical protein
MAESFYITETTKGWNMKKVGGTKILRVFASREEAIMHAQTMISRQKATISVQSRQGIWQKL